MSSPQPLCIGMALAISWLTKSGWRRGDSGVERMYDTDVYVDLAERAKLDFLFRPDTLFLATHAAATEPGFSSLDPMELLATLAWRVKPPTSIWFRPLPLPSIRLMW